MARPSDDAILRRDRRLVRVAEPPEESAPRWNEEASDVQVAVAEAVAALPVEKRIVVVLHYWLDYGVKDIADVLGIPVGTVLARLSRARADLREAIKEEENAA